MSGEQDQGVPGDERLPIPLPPGSLRPKPRVRKTSSPLGVPGPESPPPSGMGSGKPWIIGSLIPLLALVITGLLWLWSPWDRFKPESRTDGSPATGLLVRARTEQTPDLARRIPPVKPEETAKDPGELVALQVASFRTQDRAGQVLEEAKRRTGLPGVVLATTVDGVRWHRIILGAFSSESQAKLAAAPLMADGMITEVLIQPIPERWISELTGGSKEQR